MDDGLHVLQLTARNFLGLEALELEVADDGLVVCGDNGAGKTSTLRIFDACIGGSKAVPAMPIHAGAFAGEIGTVLGLDGKIAYRIEKHFEQGKEPRLVLTDAEGAPVRKPQEVLSGLFNLLTFDVGAFMQPPGAKTPEAAAKAQMELLLQACPLGVDLDALAEQRKALYDKRTLAKRDVDSVGAELRALGQKRAVPDEVDLAAKRAEVTASRDAATALKEKTDRVTQIDKDMEEIKRKWGTLKAEREKLVAEAAALPAAVDTAALEAAISAGERSNVERAGIAKDNAAYDRLLAKFGEAKKLADGLTASIEKLDAEKMAALAAAQFPVAGLGIDEALGVTLDVDGVRMPYAGLNAAKRAEIAVAVQAALAPRLRVARVDGNLFDRKTLAAVWAAAKARGLQLLVERIAQDVPGSVVIEAGAVAGHVGAAIEIPAAEARIKAAIDFAKDASELDS